MLADSRTQRHLVIGNLFGNFLLNHQARGKLLEVSPENAETFRKIQDSIFVASLDDYAVSDDLESKRCNLYHGREANNRWLDAAISLIVDASGSAGINGEHSPLDALVPASVLEISLKTPVSKEVSPSTSLAQPIERLAFKTNQDVLNCIREAKECISKTIDNSDSYSLVYSNYGTNFIKKIGRHPVLQYPLTC